MENFIYQRNRPSNNNLETQTVLMLFVEIVFILIYLVSLALVMARRAKKLASSSNRSFYTFVTVYITSKIIISIILVVKIIGGMTSEWANIDPDQVELLIKTSLILANFSINQMFLITQKIYLKHCFSILSSKSFKKKQKMLLMGIKILQVLVGMVLIIPLIIFDIDQLGYEVVNSMGISLNLIIILMFLITSFYLSFKMTGILIQNRHHDIMKRIYKVQLIILVSRVVSVIIDIIIAVYVLPNSFQQEVEIMSQSLNSYEIVLGLIFVGSVLFLLLTEGLPIMYSLRSMVIDAMSNSQFSTQNENIAESLIDRSQDDSKVSQLIYKEFRLKDFNNLTEIKGKDESIWKCKRGFLEGKVYLIRIPKTEISNYIFEDVESEISSWNSLNIRCLSKLNYFSEDDTIHFVQRYYDKNLDDQMTSITSQGQQLELALQIAEAIRQLHDKDIVHGCLTPSHIFLKDSQIKLNGLGLFSLKKYLSLVTGYTNKSIYTAIQHLRDKSNVILKPNKSADIYSYGIILYEMVTKNRQYRQLKINDIQAKFVTQNFRPKLPEHIKPQIKNLIRRCWNENRQKRPTIQQVIQTIKTLL